MTEPTFTFTTVNISAADPNRLGRFYRELLGFNVIAEEEGWVLMRPRSGGVGLSMEFDQAYQRPTWPSQPDKPAQMLHLEIKVNDLEAAAARATSLGATLAEFQPQDDVRVCLDPEGHPFCLWLGD